jgi:hypothetical protein
MLADGATCELKEARIQLGEPGQLGFVCHEPCAPPAEAASVPSLLSL